MTTMPIYDLADTWDNVGTTFKGIALNVTDTASASGSLLMDLQVGGSSRFKVQKDGRVIIGNSEGLILSNIWLFSNHISLSSSSSVRWGSTSDPFGTIDTVLARDAADTLAQRNGVNAQVFRVYGSYTDASNYERAFLKTQAGNLQFGFEKAGTGSNRVLELVGGNGIAFNALSSGIVWQISSSGHFLAGNDNTYDIGASGATRPRNLFVGTDINAGSQVFGSVAVYTAANSVFYFNTRSKIKSPSDGVLGLYNNAESDFSRLQFGGTTSSFPALKRSTTSLQVRLADDTGFTNIQGKITTETAYTAGAPTATGYIVLYDSNGTAYKIPAEAL